MNDLISIVVPVYNTDLILFEKCMYSLLHQTYEPIEIVLVDDGSTSGIEVKCDEYAKNNLNVKVLHKRNGGLSAARNSGQKMANGKWLMFVDSDDWIDENTCSDMLKKCDKKDFSLIVGGYTQHLGNKKIDCLFKYSNNKCFYGTACKELLFDVMEVPSLFSSSWGKIFDLDFLKRKELWHNEEIRQGSEDLEFMIRVLDNSTSIMVSNEHYYHYILNDKSITNSFNEKNAYYVQDCFVEIQKYIAKKKNKELLECFYVRAWYALCASVISGFMNPLNDLNYKEKLCKTKDYLGTEFSQMVMKKINVNKISFSRKVVLLLVKHNVYCPILLIAWIRGKQKKRN